MPSDTRERRGSLVAVGTGLNIIGQMTVEAMAWMRRADRLLHVVAHPLVEAILHELNPAGAESLMGLYVDGRPRSETYRAMTERALTCVREGNLTCLVSYGHPGLFATPIHDAIRIAREEGYEARLLPAISTLDCLFADLEVDPAFDGFASFDATEFLEERPAIDTGSALILWQVGVIGDPCYRLGGYDLKRLPQLVERLTEVYPAGHVGYLYEAAGLPWEKPRIIAVPLEELASIPISSLSTFYIPPARSRSGSMFSRNLKPRTNP